MTHRGETGPTSAGARALRGMAIVAAATLLLGGLALMAAASLLLWTEVRPQVAAGGWSLSRRTMILNHVWEGNELYVLLCAYLVVGAALLTAAIRLAAHLRAARTPGRTK